MDQTPRVSERHFRFMGLDLVLAGKVLVPRAETELLARRAVALLASVREKEPIAIDMCCGSGNLACAIAEGVPSAHVLAADLTDDAVRTAKINVARLGLSGRVVVRQGDLFSALAGDHVEGRAAIIVCNPPYISTARLDGDSAHLLEMEPREAFDGGTYGISIQQRLVREAPAFLRPGGHLLFEFGAGQERQAAALLTRVGVYDVLDFVRDEEGRPRVAAARLKETAP
ncbi:MAG: HemK/PrmC family methyltransferase [Shinella sp.]|jgi:release factor glutamine methyltransferase|nr:HemK/PrmC family methyltransferase [Shinella sp.]